MKKIDVAICWADNVDEIFVNKLKKQLKKNKLTFLEVTFSNINEIYEKVFADKINFKYCIDRISADNPSSILFTELLKKKKCKIINDPNAIFKYHNKTTLHKLFKRHSLPVPKTFILKPSEKISDGKLKSVIQSVKKPFILKPSYGLYENDVETNKRTIKDVRDYLSRYKAQDIFIQQKVYPSKLDRKPTWFRMIYVLEKVIPHWWNHKTQKYKRLDNKFPEISSRLDYFIKKIHDLVKVDLFSTEISIDKNNNFIIVDYVNHPIDLNSQLAHKMALPEKTLDEITEQIVQFVKRNL